MDSVAAKIIQDSVREKLIEFMVEGHGISRHMAEYHVSQMSDKERTDRLGYYIREARKAETNQGRLF